MSYVLRENTYPFLALIVLKQSRMVVCERVEGEVMRVGELVTRLTQAIRDNEGELIVERNERYGVGRGVEVQLISTTLPNFAVGSTFSLFTIDNLLQTRDFPAYVSALCAVSIVHVDLDVSRTSCCVRPKIRHSVKV